MIVNCIKGGKHKDAKEWQIHKQNWASDRLRKTERARDAHAVDIIVVKQSIIIRIRIIL